MGYDHLGERRGEEELGSFERFMALFRVVLQRAEMEVREFFNSRMVPRSLRIRPSSFGVWQPPEDGMSCRSALYSQWTA
jgi:hypothetical protein